MTNSATSPKGVQAIFWLCMATLAAYPWSEWLRLYKNFSIPDVCLIVLFLATIGRPAMAVSFSGVYFSAYGSAALFFVCFVSFTAFFSSNFGVSLSYSFQIGFIYLLLVPVIGFHVAYSGKAEKCISWLGGAYVLFYASGVGLAWLGRPFLFVVDDGTGRQNALWQGSYQLFVMMGALWLTRWRQGKRRLRHAFLALLALAAIVAAGSRTSLTGFACAAGLSIFLSNKRKSLLAAACVLLVAASVYVVTTDERVGEFLGISPRFREMGFHDASRAEMAHSAVRAIQSGEIKDLIVGRGIGTFIVDDYEDRIHDAFLQYAVEGGIASSALFLLVLAASMLRPWTVKDDAFVLGATICFSQFPFLLFSGITNERAFVLPFAIALGFLWKASLSPRAALCRAQ